MSPTGEELITIVKPEEIAKSQTTIFLRYNGETISVTDHEFFIADEQDIMLRSRQRKNAWNIDLGLPTYTVILKSQILEKKE